MAAADETLGHDAGDIQGAGDAHEETTEQFEPPIPTTSPEPWARPEPVSRGPAPGYAYVGFWRRFVALVIDGVLLTIVSYAIIIPMIIASFASADLSLLREPGSYYIDPATGLAVASPAAMSLIWRMVGQMFLGLAIVFLVQALYFVVLWTWRGATLGQLALGMEIRNEADGRRIGLGRALLRYLGFVISSWILCIGFIWVAFDRRKQGWHDKIGGTLVVRRVS